MSPRTLSGLLALSAAGLAALGAVELAPGSSDGAGPARGAAPGVTPVPEAPAPGIELPPIAALDETLERPLFLANRRIPAPTAEAEPAARPPAPRSKSDRLSLSAIVIVDDERVALLQDAATGALSRVREGESVSGWRLEAIGEESVVLTSGDAREELPLRTFEAPPPVRPRAAPGDRDQARAASGETERNLRRPRRPRRAPRQPSRQRDDTPR